MGRHLKLIKSSSCFVCFQEAESDNTVNNTSALDPIHPPAPVVKAKASSVLKNSLIISKTAEFFKQKKKQCNAYFCCLKCSRRWLNIVGEFLPVFQSRPTRACRVLRREQASLTQSTHHTRAWLLKKHTTTACLSRCRSVSKLCLK